MDMEVFSYAYLGIRNREEFESMTLSEYTLQVEAYHLREVKKDEDLHAQAFLNFSVQSMTGNKKDPEPKYPTFDSFFNRQERIDEVRSRFESNYKAKSKPALNKPDLIKAQRIREFMEIYNEKGGR